eukprot:scaffold163253_cov31-Tisochrysis_lutea.AAC.2
MSRRSFSVTSIRRRFAPSAAIGCCWRAPKQEMAKGSANAKYGANRLRKRACVACMTRKKESARGRERGTTTASDESDSTLAHRRDRLKKTPNASSSRRMTTSARAVPVIASTAAGASSRTVLLETWCERKTRPDNSS